MKNEAGETREIEKTRVFVFPFSKPLMIYRTMLVLNSICSRFISRVLLNPASVVWIKV